MLSDRRPSLSGVWQLDDGRVLMAMSTASAAATEGGEQWQPTIRVDYVDVTGGAVQIAPPRLRAVPE